jgi:predicted RNase H-like nuclease (RuvC/YqgF family)
MIDETEYFGVDIKTHAQYVPQGFWKSHTQAIETVEEQIKTLKEDLELARGKVHDKKLNDSIDRIEILQYLSESVKYTLNQFSRRKINTERIDEELEALKITSHELRSELQEINHRIEELLVGDEAE